MFMSHRIHLFAFTQMLLSHEFFLLSSPPLLFIYALLPLRVDSKFLDFLKYRIFQLCFTSGFHSFSHWECLLEA